ncbi:MAG: hypothetical protein ACFFDX_03545 [Candidatus Odinarchaeota archaeon]
MEITKSEDCLIFYGLTPKISKKKLIHNGLLEFMKEKQAIDPSDRFNLILFNKDGPNYLEHFTFDPLLILRTLKSLERSLVKANIASGIFIATTFIIEVFKKITEKLFRLLILIDHKTDDISPQLMPVLENLIEKIKDLPFIIDVICLDEQYVNSKPNLMNLIKQYHGEFYQVENKNFLETISNKVAKKKYIKTEFYGQNNLVITAENKPFFINLADDPPDFDKIVSCSICFQRDNEGLVECPACRTVTHKACWAQWAKISSFGIPHVFRCHNCFNILKLDKDYVLDVQAGRMPISPEIKQVEKKNIVEYLREIESKTQPKVIHTEDPFAPRSKILICPNCSKIIKSEKRNCPSCGFLLY